MEELKVEGRFDRGVSMVAWAYNEEMNIGAFVERAHALMEATCEEFEIVVIDDASTDRTLEIARDLQRRYPRLRVIHNERNLDCGWNMRLAIQSARKEFLFWQTVDWSYDITHLRTFLEFLKHYDVVQGVRAIDNEPDFLRRWRVLGLFRQVQTAKRSDTLMKAVVSVVNYLVIRTLFRLPFRDYQNVTIYPTRLIQSCRLESTSSFINPECLLKAYWKGARFKEVPIGFLKREAGEAKGTRPRAIWGSIRNIVAAWVRLILCGRPEGRGRGIVHGFNAREWSNFGEGAPSEKGVLRKPIPESPSAPKPEKRLWAILKVGLMIGLIVYLLTSRQLDFGLMRALLRPGFLPVALAIGGLFVGFQGLVAVRQRMLLRHFGLEMGMLDSFRVVIIGSFFNIFLPGSTGGDLARLYYLGRLRRGLVGEMAGLLLADRLFGIAGLAILACLAVLGFSATILGQGMQIDGGLMLLAASSLGILAAIVGGFLLMRNEGVVEFVRRRLSWISQGSAARGFLRGFRAFSRRRRVVAAAIALSVGVHACSVICVVLLTAVMVGERDAFASTVSVPLVMMAAMLPFTPGNIGWMEYVAGVLYGTVGASGGATVFAVWRIAVALLSLPGGALYALRKREFSVTAPEEADPAA